MSALFVHPLNANHEVELQKGGVKKGFDLANALNNSVLTKDTCVFFLI